MDKLLRFLLREIFCIIRYNLFCAVFQLNFRRNNMVGIRNNKGQVLATYDNEPYWSDDQNAAKTFNTIESAISYIEKVLIPIKLGSSLEVFFTYWWYVHEKQ